VGKELRRRMSWRFSGKYRGLGLSSELMPLLVQDPWLWYTQLS
jgi:hypothetical protein